MYKNKKSGKKQTTRNLGDITINDFANSSVCKNRTKKSNGNVNRVLKQLEDEKTWDEKISDFEGDFDFVQEENEDGTISYVMRKVELRRRKKTSSTSDDKQIGESGKNYPIDIWFLISEYIQPEDIGRFASICKTSFDVVCTAKFWFNIYKRFYKSVPNLPERLQPECMHRKYGLRTSVIRALYYMYPPFVERLKSLTTFEEHPDCLLRRQCILTWHQKKKKQWLYYFKLKRNVNYSLSHNGRSELKKQPDILETLEDVSANADENCRILQVTCLHFISFPVVMGLTLTSVSLTLSQGFRHYRLQLGFGSGIQSSTLKGIGGSSTSVINLDPVINVKVLDWWHPLYPTNYNNIEFLLNKELE